MYERRHQPLPVQMPQQNKPQRGKYWVAFWECIIFFLFFKKKNLNKPSFQYFVWVVPSFARKPGDLPATWWDHGFQGSHQWTWVNGWFLPLSTMSGTHKPLCGSELYRDQLPNFFCCCYSCICWKWGRYKIHVSAAHSEIKLGLPFRW